MELGKAIRLCRQSKALTLETVAGKANMSTSYLSKIERCGIANLPVGTLEKIRKALDIPAPILAFLASDPIDLKALDPELHRRLESTIVSLIKESA